MSTQTCKLKSNRYDVHQISSTYFRPPIINYNQYFQIKIH